MCSVLLKEIELHPCLYPPGSGLVWVLAREQWKRWTGNPEVKLGVISITMERDTMPTNSIAKGEQSKVSVKAEMGGANLET